MDQVKAVNEMLDSLRRGADASESIAGQMDGAGVSPEVTAIVDALMIIEFAECAVCHEPLTVCGEHADHCHHGQLEQYLKDQLQ